MKVEACVKARYSGRSSTSSWAFVLSEGKKTLVECRSGSDATNHRRAELEAVDSAIQSAFVDLGADAVVVYGASPDVRKAFKAWSKTWEKNGWMNSSGEKVADQDLWLAILHRRDRVSFSRSRHSTMQKVEAYAEAVLSEQESSRTISKITKRVIGKAS